MELSTAREWTRLGSRERYTVSVLGLYDQQVTRGMAHSACRPTSRRYMLPADAT